MAAAVTALRRWLPAASNERLLVLDIGSGFNTPKSSAGRWNERRTRFPLRGSCVSNRSEPELQVRRDERGLSIAGGTLDVLKLASTPA